VRIAVVGNGPSAKGRGAEIDAADFVVRINHFERIAAEDSGRKLSAWARYGNTGVPVPRPEQWCELWYCLPPSRTRGQCTPDTDWGNLAYEVNAAEWRPMICVPEYYYQVMAKAVNPHRFQGPSTGFVAVGMAIHRAGPGGQVDVYGFDAITPDKPGWDEARGGKSWPEHIAHDFVREKQLFAEFRDKGLWCGETCTTKISWPGAPC
jgi:hypothetical protein